MALEWKGPEVIAALQQAAFRAVTRGTEKVKTRMVERIQNPPKSGRIYRRNNVEHQASAPGESPASDTGRLAQSVTTSYNSSKIAGYVNVSAKHAAPLEFGTPRIAPRPYARVSLAEEAPGIKADLAQEIAKATR